MAKIKAVRPRLIFAIATIWHIMLVISFPRGSMQFRKAFSLTVNDSLVLWFMAVVAMLRAAILRRRAIGQQVWGVRRVYRTEPRH